MIDWDRIAEIRDEVGAEGFSEVADLFLEEVEETLARLRDWPDPSRLEADLHFLKGSALNLGLNDFSARCAAAERAAAAGNQGAVDVLAIDACFVASKQSMLGDPRWADFAG